MRNVSIALPDHIYAELCGEAERSRTAAEDVAFKAIESWLRVRRRLLREDELSRFAVEYGGTAVDLDEELEAAAAEYLLESERAAS